jgi:hypothetical protein
MTTETIDHTTFTKLAEAGAVRSAHIVGQPGGWGILVKYGMTERALAAQRSHQVRIFRKFETLVGYLKGVGIVRFDVDAVNWDVESLTTRTRPDTTATLKKAHAAAAYDKWLKAEVQEAIDDTRPSIPNVEVKKHFAGKREALRKRIAADKA